MRRVLFDTVSLVLKVAFVKMLKIVRAYLYVWTIQYKNVVPLAIISENFCKYRYVTKLCNLVTIIREYTALHMMHDYPLASKILGANHLEVSHLGP